jgi:Transposase IS116/IS110/IS902 family
MGAALVLGDSVVAAASVLRLLGECGHDTSDWPTFKHCTSWLGLVPGNSISGSARSQRPHAPELE